MERETKIQAMNKTELASAYGVGLHTFKKWIKPVQSEIGEYIGRAYTPQQVEKIFKFLGRP